MSSSCARVAVATGKWFPHRVHDAPLGVRLHRVVRARSKGVWLTGGHICGQDVDGVDHGARPGFEHAQRRCAHRQRRSHVREDGVARHEDDKVPVEEGEGGRRRAMFMEPAGEYDGVDPLVPQSSRSVGSTCEQRREYTVRRRSSAVTGRASASGMHAVRPVWQHARLE